MLFFKAILIDASFYAQVRIMFEVQDLKFATLATVSRCGMVWFSEDVLALEMIFEHQLTRMRNISIDEAEDVGIRSAGVTKSDVVSPTLQVDTVCILPFSLGLVSKTLTLSPSVSPSLFLSRFSETVLTF